MIALPTRAGEFKAVLSSMGAPNGFADLRRAATKEHLGHGSQPFVASTADLARMAAALHRDQDIARLRELRRIMELEVRRELTVSAPVRTPSPLGRARGRASERRLER